MGFQAGWTFGWPTYRKQWTRLIALSRWLGAAHHVEHESLVGEWIDYDCIKAFEQGVAPPRDPRCWGDVGNGVQIGWFVWSQAVLRRELGLLESSEHGEVESVYV